jgi:hypothetical protein
MCKILIFLDTDMRKEFWYASKELIMRCNALLEVLKK